MEASGQGQRKGAAATACVGKTREEMRRQQKGSQAQYIRDRAAGGRSMSRSFSVWDCHIDYVRLGRR